MAVRVLGNTATLETEGKQTNPGTSTVLADTGALPKGVYEVRILPGCSVAATFLLQRRNAANDASVGDVPVIYAAAGQTAQYLLTIALAEGERFRVLPESAITGTAAVTLNVEQVS